MLFKIIFLLLNLFFLCKSNLHDFKMITWNAGKGNKWEEAFKYFDISGADVMAIQEIGPLNGQSHNVIQNNFIETVYLGIDPNDENCESLSILEYEYRRESTNQRITHFIYYFDRETRTQEIHYTQDQINRLNNGNNISININQQQNMAIITRQRVDQLFILPMLTSTGQYMDNSNERYYINRPVFGVRIQNTAFFNAHMEPSDRNNEALAVINILTDFIEQINPNLEWILMGDFNRIPVYNGRNLIELSDRRFSPRPNFRHVRRLVNTGVSTRSPSSSSQRELDYAIMSLNNQNQYRQFIANLLTLYFANHRLTYPTLLTVSDHVPVIIHVSATIIG